MPSLKDIRSRIASTKSTQQITRAMKMVSAAKLRRAQNNIVSMRPYANKILQVIHRLAASHQVEHPLLMTTETSREKPKCLVIAVTSDRGLCGGFNASINKATLNYYLTHQLKFETLDFIVIGRKGSEFLKRRDIPVKETILNLAKDISYSMAEKIARQVIEAFVEGEYDQIHIIYNEFKSAISQKVIVEQLLPIDAPSSGTGDSSSISQSGPDTLFEPAPQMMMDDLLKKYFAVQVYRCLSESIASEHGARMTAMENATKNAGEMIQTLTLTYNKLRQASITKELIEITSGAEALN